AASTAATARRREAAGQRFARPISFRPGAIEFEPAPGAPSILAQRLSSRLKDWTGQPWLVAAKGGGGGESLAERERREKVEARQAIEAHPFVQTVMQAFPGAELVDVRPLPMDVLQQEGAPDVAPMAAGEAETDPD
ncbi:MAG: DNA polymerase III subunit gamma/tau, partial [Caulobacteraceae bacterium]